MILNAGRKRLMQYFSALVDSPGDNVVLGIGDSPVTTADTALDFELFSLPIEEVNYTKTYDTEYELVITTSVPPETSSSIREYGISGLEADNLDLSVSSQTILTFDDGEEDWDVGDFVDSKAYGRGLQLSPTAGQSLSSYLDLDDLDFDSYSIGSDYFSVAVDSSGGVTGGIIRFITTTSFYDISFGTSGGYEIIHVPMSNVLNSVSDLSEIVGIEVIASAGGTDGTITFDALRANIFDTNRVPETLYVRGLINEFIIEESGQATIDIKIPVVFS